MKYEQIRTVRNFQHSGTFRAFVPFQASSWLNMRDFLGIFLEWTVKSSLPWLGDFKVPNMRLWSTVHLIFKKKEPENGWWRWTNYDTGVWAEQRMMTLKLFQGWDPLSTQDRALGLDPLGFQNEGPQWGAVTSASLISSPQHTKLQLNHRNRQKIV